MADFGDSSPTPERLHALDAVRGFALLLGIIFHATVSLVPSSAKIWIVADSHHTTASQYGFGWLLHRQTELIRTLEQRMPWSTNSRKSD
jgi:uncharacterized membrane protein YeiB